MPEQVTIEGTDDQVHTYRFTGVMSDVSPRTARKVLVVCRTCKETLLDTPGPVGIEAVEAAVDNHG